MLHLHDLKIGDRVMADFEDKKYKGTVEEISFEKVCVMLDDNDQQNWYEPAQLEPIPLTPEGLASFGFVKSLEPELDGNGQAWVRGPFILSYVEKGNNQHIILDYLSEQPREIKDGLYVHQLQHHYHEMTKVFLEK
jgi:hypothetical protein